MTEETSSLRVQRVRHELVRRKLRARDWGHGTGVMGLGSGLASCLLRTT